MPFKMKKLALLFLLTCSQLVAKPGFHEPWGKDADVRLPPAEEPAPKPSLLALGAEKIIWLHQNVITQADGPRSHFRPCSSQYMKLAIRKHGFFKGFAMGCDRLLRENSDPWHYRTIEIDGITHKWDPVK
jgi:putative component of membrane protein insertase Oxa1/YidC/SpoIIIJ protein YidD